MLKRRIMELYYRKCQIKMLEKKKKTKESLQKKKKKKKEDSSRMDNSQRFKTDAS